MERNELLRRMVLNKISDDYENVDQMISKHRNRMCQARMSSLSDQTLSGHWPKLIDDGLAKAHLLPGMEQARDPSGYAAARCVKENLKTDFYLTQKGLDLQHSEGAWSPFRR